MASQITLDQADAIVAACRAEADAVGQPMNIAVVDDGGNLVAFASMDGTKLIGVDIAQRKALTAVYFQMDTQDLAPLVQPGAPLFGIESTTGAGSSCSAGACCCAPRTVRWPAAWASARAPSTRTTRSRRPERRPSPAEAAAGRSVRSAG